MDQAKELHNVLLIQQTNKETENEGWARLAKAFKGLAATETQTRELPISFKELSTLCQTYSQVFLDLSFAENLSIDSQLPNLTLIGKSSFPWNEPESRRKLLPILARHSCLLLDQIPTTDLIRIMHLYLNPKRLAGVTPLLEKGAVIVGEKVQSLDQTGTLLDKLTTYLERVEGFELKERLMDLRQVLSGVLTKSFKHASEATNLYPTVDFQVGASKSKIVVNIRFPRGSLSIYDISLQSIDGRDLFWQQLWQCSDLLMATHHLQYDEIELMLLLNQASRPNLQSFRSFLSKTSERSLKKDNLLIAPASFDFQILSDIRLKDQEKVTATLEKNSDQIDLGSLPEEVVKKIEILSEQSAFLKEQNDRQGSLLREAQIKFAQVAKELSQKRGEVVRISKATELQQEAFRSKIAELEKQLETTKNAKVNQATTVDAASANNLNEAISKLETSLRAAENEKNQFAERASNEQKKVSAYEQKYSALYKELSIKDKEIIDLKATVLKIKKESTANATSAAATGAKDAASEANTAKIKEFEAREGVLKQELRKVMFKLENQEKNVKFIQTEAGEKTKLLEQKLQGAKTKEVELLKKIDELSAALKKASKAA